MERSSLRLPGYAFLLTFILFTSSNCSVKEDRDLCPCRVCFDYSKLFSDNIAGQIEDGVIETTIFDRDGKISCQIRSYNENRADIELSRGQYTATTLKFSKNAPLTEGRYLVNQADSETGLLFGESVSLDATTESILSCTNPYKQFISVTLHFAQPVHDITVDLSAPSAALDKLNLEGTDEPYTASAKADGETVSFRLLRQAGNDINLTFTHATTGSVIAQIGLGSLLTKSGFDFKAKSLNDIDIFADLRSGTISIRVQDWQSEPISIIF